MLWRKEAKLASSLGDLKYVLSDEGCRDVDAYHQNIKRRAEERSLSNNIEVIDTGDIVSGKIEGFDHSLIGDYDLHYRYKIVIHDLIIEGTENTRIELPMVLQFKQHEQLAQRGIWIGHFLDLHIAFENNILGQPGNNGNLSIRMTKNAHVSFAGNQSENIRLCVSEPWAHNLPDEGKFWSLSFRDNTFLDDVMIVAVQHTNYPESQPDMRYDHTGMCFFSGSVFGIFMLGPYAKYRSLGKNQIGRLSINEGMNIRLRDSDKIGNRDCADSQRNLLGRIQERLDLTNGNDKRQHDILSKLIVRLTRLIEVTEWHDWPGYIIRHHGQRIIAAVGAVLFLITSFLITRYLGRLLDMLS